MVTSCVKRGCTEIHKQLVGRQLTARSKNPTPAVRLPSGFSELVEATSFTSYRIHWIILQQPTNHADSIGPVKVKSRSKSHNKVNNARNTSSKPVEQEQKHWKQHFLNASVLYFYALSQCSQILQLESIGTHHTKQQQQITPETTRQCNTP